MEEIEVYLVFSDCGPYCGDELRRAYRTKDAAQAWINAQKFPDSYYIREEELK